MLAYPYGVPQVMSQLHVQRPRRPGRRPRRTAPPAAVSCGGGWECEHRWRTTANMVGFRNAAAGTGVTNWWSNGFDQIAFGRGSAAFAAFNRAGGALTRPSAPACRPAPTAT